MQERRLPSPCSGAFHSGEDGRRNMELNRSGSHHKERAIASAWAPNLANLRSTNGVRAPPILFVTKASARPVSGSANAPDPPSP